MLKEPDDDLKKQNAGALTPVNVIFSKTIHFYCFATTFNFSGFCATWL